MYCKDKYGRKEAGVMHIESILAFVPLITLIVLALVTRNMMGSMVAAVCLAMLFLHGSFTVE